MDEPNEKSSWYPAPPPDVIPASSTENVIPNETHTLTNIWHPEGPIRYTSSNIWHSSITNEQKERCRKLRPTGIEVRNLRSDHFLYGERGLFATVKFHRCDIIGEYTGYIVGDNAGGHYCAALEDKDYKDSLGVDAGECGSEMRFINSHLNIEFEANVSMRTVYIDTYPHLVLVCMKDIEIGDEFLLDYGEAYNKAYLTPQPPETPFTTEEIKHVLPFMGGGDSDDEEGPDTV